MKLYMADFAPNPRRVMIFLSALSLTPEALGIEVIKVDLGSGENKAADFLAINPLGLVPVLVLDNGEVIADSQAICRFLGSLPAVLSKPSLFGDATMQQVKIEEYSRQAELEIVVPIMYAFQLSHPFWADKKQQLPAFAPIGIGKATAGFDYFNQLLKHTDFLVDNRVSVSDITLYVGLDFAKLAGVRVSEQSHPFLFSFYQRMHALFALQKK